MTQQSHSWAYIWRKQYSVMTYMGKESKKEWIYVYV